MPRTARKLSNSGYYHIVSRGIGKQILFEEESDYLFFLGILKKYRKEENFDIIAYCLMENHYHLLLKIDSDMDRIMKKIATAYAFYFNTKYERVGHLFQDRYKSIPIENDLYLLSVVRYIHNNPAKACICPADKYRWSSWRAYTGSSSLVNTDLVLGLTNGLNGFLTLSGLEDEDESVEHLEVTDSKRIADSRAHRVIRDILHLDSGTQIQGLNREGRDLALRKLKAEGLSVRQIERLTGINRGVVLKA